MKVQSLEREIQDAINRIAEDITLIRTRHKKRNIDNIERITRELNEINEQTKYLKTGKSFKELIEQYKSFLNGIFLFMLEFGEMESVPNPEAFRLQQIGNVVRAQHYPIGKLFLRKKIPPLVKIEYKTNPVTLTVEKTRILPEEKPGTLVTGEEVESFKNKLLDKVKNEEEVVITWLMLENLPFVHRIVILEILGILARKYSIIETSKGLKIKKDKNSFELSRTKIYKA